jgi:hypothetical protein
LFHEKCEILALKVEGGDILHDQDSDDEDFPCDNNNDSEQDSEFDGSDAENNDVHEPMEVGNENAGVIHDAMDVGLSDLEHAHDELSDNSDHHDSVAESTPGPSRPAAASTSDAVHNVTSVRSVGSVPAASTSRQGVVDSDSDNFSLSNHSPIRAVSRSPSPPASPPPPRSASPSPSRPARQCGRARARGGGIRTRGPRVRGGARRNAVLDVPGSDSGSDNRSRSPSPPRPAVPRGRAHAMGRPNRAPRGRARAQG